MYFYAIIVTLLLQSVVSYNPTGETMFNGGHKTTKIQNAIIPNAKISDAGQLILRSVKLARESKPTDIMVRNLNETWVNQTVPLIVQHFINATNDFETTHQSCLSLTEFNMTRFNTGKNCYGSVADNIRESLGTDYLVFVYQWAYGVLQK
ncbi:unnamed protein product [Oppiella nova]|uniref:Uncharacterized protein n=1 Tax=Oppiella nova TaxID=334625 RepID=A0A7R9QFN1_9ACAR|nr:unnamed protein product [Oppiella nova]CAG2164884.1 unnamed protein product [Oppiella nova]